MLAPLSVQRPGQVSVASAYPNAARGFRFDEEFADSFLGIQKEETGFELDAFYEVSPIAYLARYRYTQDGKGLLCDDLEGYGLYILQSVRTFVINLEVCADWTVQYDDAFVERVFDSLVYSNQR